MLKYLGTFLFFLASIFLIGCEDEHSVENGGGGGANGNFRARIAGVPWAATTVKTATRTNGLITLKGRNDLGQQIQLQVKDSGVHNYVLHNTSITNVGTLIDSTFSPYDPYTTNQWFTDSIYGNVNISFIDTVMKTISGTFKMKVFRTVDSDEVTITDGTFSSISYGVPNIPPPASNFFVKVDGVEFVENNFTGMEMTGLILLTGTNGSGSSVALTMPANIAVGTHSLAASGLNSGLYISGANSYSSESGTLTILEHNSQTNRIKGTFNFVGANITDPALPDVNLTEGSFEITYN